MAKGASGSADHVPLRVLYAIAVSGEGSSVPPPMGSHNPPATTKSWPIQQPWPSLCAKRGLSAPSAQLSARGGASRTLAAVTSSLRGVARR